MILKAAVALVVTPALIGMLTLTTTNGNVASMTHTLGVSVKGLPTDLSPLDSFENMVGRNVDIVDYYNDFTDPNFNTAAATAITDRGAVPMLAWAAEDSSLPDPVNQPAYTLESIIDGSHDALLNTWATEIAAWGKPVMLRFAPEMNGNWNPYSEGVNGNTAGQYVRAWRHVHAIFVADRATNVQWIWNPNVDYPGSTSLAELYPGDAYVDYIGLDGYNWGTSQSWSTWQTPQQVFNPTIADVHSFTHKPILLTEVASSELGGNKAQWIHQFFAWIESSPAIIGFVWFEFNKETNWLVQSSTAAKQAFIAGLRGY